MLAAQQAAAKAAKVQAAQAQAMQWVQRGGELAQAGSHAEASEAYLTAASLTDEVGDTADAHSLRLLAEQEMQSDRFTREAKAMAASAMAAMTHEQTQLPLSVSPGVAALPSASILPSAAAQTLPRSPTLPPVSALPPPTAGGAGGWPAPPAAPTGSALAGLGGLWGGLPGGTSGGWGAAPTPVPTPPSGGSALGGSALGGGWTSHLASDGKLYYHHGASGKSTWDIAEVTRANNGALPVW